VQQSFKPSSGLENDGLCIRLGAQAFEYIPKPWYFRGFQPVDLRSMKDSSKSLRVDGVFLSTHAGVLPPRVLSIHAHRVKALMDGQGTPGMKDT
jgi:hypothetical protein